MFSPYSRFWKAAALLPLASAAVSSSAQATVPSFVDASQREAGRWSFHHENVLGTSLELSVKAATRADADRAEAAALVVFDHDEALLSTWRADSEVSRWARTSQQPIKVSPELFEVLAAFDQWRDRTGGALDASVETATRLWRNATAEGRTPSDREIAVAIEGMQQPHWSLDQQHQTATRLTDVPLALASFAKSYITSRAADAALKAGAAGVMFNVGGDVVVRGNLTQIVEITNPNASAENDATLDRVTVRDRSVATSGSYRRGFQLTNAELSVTPHFSHILDPRTALPANHVLSSTIIARDAMVAGALATAFSVLSVDESRKLAASIPGTQYLLVLANGEQVQSADWPRTSAFRTVAFDPRASAPVAAGLWNPAYELSLNLTLPRIEDPRYRRPYVAVWVEDADHFPVRTVALWTEKPRWINELKVWYREDQVRTLAEGSDISRTVSSATRSPGTYSLKWDGKDNAGKLVETGKYTVCIEVSREHGGYDIQRQEITFDNNKPQHIALSGEKELGAVTLDYRKR